MFSPRDDEKSRCYFFCKGAWGPSACQVVFCSWESKTKNPYLCPVHQNHYSMRINNLLVVAAMIALLGGGCVSSQKYNDMTTARDHYRAQYESMRSVEQENEELKNELRIAQNKLRGVEEVLNRQSSELQMVKEARAVLAQEYDKVAGENSKILSEYSETRTRMDEQLTRTNEELYLRDRQLAGMEETIGMQSYNLQSREERVAELERMLAEKDAQMAQMRLSLDNALRGFEAKDVSVAERNGKIYVTMNNQLLFPQGSAKVDAGGENALIKLAKALRENPDIDIIVEGHTDNTGAVEYNLELSLDRAMAVTKILSVNGVLPLRITTSGKGMHHPVVPNTTTEGKAQNRRVEVILSPNLDKLYELSK